MKAEDGSTQVRSSVEKAKEDDIKQDDNIISINLKE